MLKFNYVEFKNAIKKVEEENYRKLQEDIVQVKAFVEKGLTLFLESTSNTARTTYSGIDL